MKAFRNSGCGVCITLKEEREYILVASLGKHEFIVAYFNERVGG